MTSRNRAGWLFMVVGMFMAILDIQIVASSLPEIQGGLSVGPDEIAWVQTAYLIAEVVMIPLSGFLTRLMSTRTVFVLSAAGFTCASVACAFTDTLTGMVFWRAIQGFVGGAMIPTVFATAYAVFPRDRQASMTVIIGLVATMAPTFGPTIGGWLTTTFSWHWLFLVNVVPGILVTGGVATLVRVDSADWSLLKGFDALGLASMAIFLGCLEYTLDEGPKEDWLDDRIVVIAATLAALGAVVFFWRVLTHWNPIVDLHAFKNRNFAVGCAFSFCLGIGLYGAVFLMPQFLARVRGYSALDIGLVMMVTGMFQIVSGPIAGNLARVMDLRLMMATGIALFATGSALNGFMTADHGYRELFLPQALRGVALLLCFVPINRLALGTLPPQELKNASGLYNLMRNMGGAFGLAIIDTLLNEPAPLEPHRPGGDARAGRGPGDARSAGAASGRAASRRSRAHRHPQAGAPGRA